MPDFKNPFRPGAGHTPPCLAGREDERQEFLRLLSQEIILENVVLTGLRGVGKTVLLETFKPQAINEGWSWVGTDLSESATVSEDKIAVRLCTDLSIITSGIVINTSEVQKIGFSGDVELTEHTLGYQALIDIYNRTPGLSLDKLKKVLETAWLVLSRTNHPKGIIFAYDEAQNLSDQAQKEKYPLALLLDAFQSLQRQGMPLMLVLTGLPTLFPKLVESRTFSERMFRVIFLKSLKQNESREAIHKPIEDDSCPIRLSEDSVQTIIDMSGGYPYFIQFICREVYDAFMQKIDKGEKASVPVQEIEQKLDTDFFSGRWARATDRQRELLSIIAQLENCNDEFSVQEVVERSKVGLEKSFSSSHVHQMLGALSTQGLVFKNRHGRYSFAVPLMDKFIIRQGLIT